MTRRSIRLWRWLIGLQLGAAMVLAGMLLMGIRINLEGSMPQGVYRLEKEGIGKGDVVMFRLASRWQQLAWERMYLGERSQSLLKFVCGVPGDKYRIDRQGIRINGTSLPDSAPLERDSEGRAMPFEIREGTLAQGQFLVISDGKAHGFDSRYFGVVEERDVQGRMVLIYRFNPAPSTARGGMIPISMQEAPMKGAMRGCPRFGSSAVAARARRPDSASWTAESIGIEIGRPISMRSQAPERTVP